MRTALLILVALAGPALAAEDLTVLKSDEKSAPRSLLRAYLTAEAQKHFDARRATVGALKTPAEIEQRQKMLRARFVESLGGFPEKTPLRPRVVGKVRGDGYTIEKVIYESRPNHHVTANLYLPDGKGPFPGVLMPIGHSNNGKAAEYIQRGAILLAKNGFAVLAYDPIGQGERRQLLDRGKPVLGGSTTEHTMAGVGALLVGWNTATYRIWDGIRSLDYLASRPEVDAKRLGCTGCSGGGTLTSYLMVLDDRIVAAAPSCYITSLERLFATRGPQDAEQNITGQVAFGMEHADYLTMRAPRPTLICAATHDFFDIQGTWASFREAKRLYGLLGHPERIDLVESNTGHGFPRLQREGMVRWMRRWLMDKDDAVVEADARLHKDAELLCTRTGQVLDDLGGVSVFGLNARRAKELAALRAKRSAPSREKQLAEVARLLGLKRPVARASMREAGTVKGDRYTIRKLVFETEQGVLVPGRLFGEKGPLVVYAGDTSDRSRIEQLVTAGRRVLAVDLRGLGESAPAVAKKIGPFGVDFREAYMALHLARPLVGQRTHDLLAVLEAMASETRDGFELVGVGKAAPAVLHAAAFDERVKRVTLERMVVSWTAVATATVSHDQLTNAVPAALTVYDLPELAGMLAPRPVTVRDGVDAVGKAVTLPALREAYAAAGKGRVVLEVTADGTE